MTGRGILLIGHGTRSEQGARELRVLAERLAERVDPAPVEPCFLELCEPSIGCGWRALVARGASHVHAAPALLFAAGHLRRDVPRALVECAAATPGVAYELGGPFSCHQRLLDLSRRRYEEAVGGIGRGRSGGNGVERTALVMVGRGSMDDCATADMRRLTELRGRQSPVARLRTAFMAMAEPRLAAVLEEVAADRDIETVVVQPHLLFAGELFEQVRRLVAEMAGRYPHQRWVATDYLGPSAEVVEVLAERFASLPRFCV